MGEDEIYYILVNRLKYFTQFSVPFSGSAVTELSL